MINPTSISVSSPSAFCYETTKRNKSLYPSSTFQNTQEYTATMKFSVKNMTVQVSNPTSQHPSVPQIFEIPSAARTHPSIMSMQNDPPTPSADAFVVDLDHLNDNNDGDNDNTKVLVSSFLKAESHSDHSYHADRHFFVIDNEPQSWSLDNLHEASVDSLQLRDWKNDKSTVASSSISHEGDNNNRSGRYAWLYNPCSILTIPLGVTCVLATASFVVVLG